MPVLNLVLSIRKGLDCRSIYKLDGPQIGPQCAGPSDRRQYARQDLQKHEHTWERSAGAANNAVTLYSTRCMRI